MAGSDSPTAEPTILVVDDEAPIRALLVRLLSGSGGRVVEASCGAEALAAYSAYRPDVVISDIRMPGMDGLALLRAIHAADPDAEVILITGFGEMEDTVAALRYGASDFIAKPFDLAFIEHSVRRCVERRRLKALERDYTRRLEEEVRARTEELVRANEELARLGKTREDFLALIAHGLRSPLAGMGLAEIALDEINALSREQIADYLRGILESFRRLHLFSERALLYSRLMAGAGVHKKPGVDFAAIVREGVSAAREGAAEAGLVLTERCTLGPLAIEGDQKLLRFLVGALLDNAIRHNRPGGSVHVELERFGKGFVFSVADTGKGIEPAELRGVFEPLAAVDVLHHRTGTALSLAICRLVARAHGMEIACQSQGVGRGATFAVTFRG